MSAVFLISDFQSHFLLQSSCNSHLVGTPFSPCEICSSSVLRNLHCNAYFDILRWLENEISYNINFVMIYIFLWRIKIIVFIAGLGIQLNCYLKCKYRATHVGSIVVI